MTGPDLNPGHFLLEQMSSLLDDSLRHHECMNAERRFYTADELRDALGRGLVGRDLSYELARKYGLRLGKRLLVPARVVEALLEGRLADLEAKNPAGQGGA